MPNNENEDDRQLAQSTASVRWLISLTDLAAGISLLMLMLVAFADVIGRSFLNAPLPGASELTEILVAATVCFALPSLTLMGLHATIDILDGVIPQGLVRYQHLFVSLLSAVGFGCIAWRVWIEGDKTAKFGGETAVLEIPMAPVLYGIAVLFGITALAFVLTAFNGTEKSK